MIKLIDVNKSYKVGKQKYQVLKNVNLVVEDKEMIAILGRSGSGKTTLLNIIGTLDKNDSGNYSIDNTRIDNMSEGQKASFRNQNIGFVMQDYSLLNHSSVLFNVMLPGLSGWDGLKIYVTGNEDRIVISSQFDNLGKGASGAAIECMNLVLGCEATKGLQL